VEQRPRRLAVEGQTRRGLPEVRDRVGRTAGSDERFSEGALGARKVRPGQRRFVGVGQIARALRQQRLQSPAQHGALSGLLAAGVAGVFPGRSLPFNPKEIENGRKMGGVQWGGVQGPVEDGKRASRLIGRLRAAAQGSQGLGQIKPRCRMPWIASPRPLKMRSGGLGHRGRLTGGAERDDHTQGVVQRRRPGRFRQRRRQVGSEGRIAAGVASHGLPGAREQLVDPAGDGAFRRAGEHLRPLPRDRAQAALPKLFEPVPRCPNLGVLKQSLLIC
jgi:hypothetical protein